MEVIHMRRVGRIEPEEPKKEPTDKKPIPKKEN